MKKLLFVLAVILCFSYGGNAGLKAEPSGEVPTERMPDLPQKMERLNSAIKHLDHLIK